MDLKRLRTFVTVAELGSISAAAQKLRITQPALSRQLQNLQAEFGVRLFDPVGRRLELSTEGMELLPSCRLLLRQADDVLEQARSLRDAESGVLRIGATPQSAANLLPGFLRKFADRYPRVRVEIVEAGSFDQIVMLRRGELHAILSIRADVGPAVTGQVIATGHVVAVFDPSHFDLPGDVIDVRALHQRPVLVLRSTYGTRREFEAACQLARVYPIVAHESTAPETLQALARVGHGIAILPTTARLDTENLRVSPLMHREQLLEMDLMVYWSIHRQLPGYAQVFTDILGQHVRAIIPQPGSLTRPRL